MGEEENSTALFNTLLSPENYSSSSLEYNELQGNKLQLGCQHHEPECHLPKCTPTKVPTALAFEI